MSRFASLIAILLLVLPAGWAQSATESRPEGDWAEPNVPRTHRREHREWTSDREPRHIIGQDFLVRTNEVVGDLVLVGGSADIQGTVEGDIVMVGGPVKVTGEVTGGVVLVGGGLDVAGTIARDVVVVLGGANLKDSARLESSGIFIGGPFHFDSGAELLGETKLFPLGNVLRKVEWFKEWLVHGLLLGRLLPLGVTWPWIVAALMLFAYLIVLVLFPTAIKNTWTALEARPIASLIAGILAIILAAPLAVVLAITVVGIAAIPFVNIAMLLAAVVGKTAVLCFLGRGVGRSAGGFLQAPLAAFAVGAVLLTIVYMVPVLGILAWGFGTILGLGAAFVALGNSWSREQSLAAPIIVSREALRNQPASAAAAPSPSNPTASMPEHVALGLQPPVAPQITPADTLILQRAGFWRRFFATLLDLILVCLVIPAVGPFFIPLALIYYVGMWTWKGTTVGMLVLGLKVIRTDGRPVNFTVALVRGLSSLFSALVLFLGFLWAIWDREKQTWHDRIAGTLVVRMPGGFALL